MELFSKFGRYIAGPVKLLIIIKQIVQTIWLCGAIWVIFVEKVRFYLDDRWLAVIYTEECINYGLVFYIFMFKLQKIQAYLSLRGDNRKDLERRINRINRRAICFSSLIGGIVAFYIGL